MSRYAVMPRQPRASLDYPEPLLPGLSVDDNRPVDTGLVDRHGNPIMRLPEPMGFAVPTR